MTSEGRVCLGLADVKRYGVPYFGRSDSESASTKWNWSEGSEDALHRKRIVRMTEKLFPFRSKLFNGRA